MHKKVHMKMVAINLGHLVNKKEYKLPAIGKTYNAHVSDHARFEDCNNNICIRM